MLMADHPWSCRRKALRTRACLCHQPRWLTTRTAAATGSMGGLVFAQCPRCVGTALIDRMRLCCRCRHARESRCGQNDPWCGDRALRTILRHVVFRHRPHVSKWSAIITKIFVNRHSSSPSDCPFVIATLTRRWQDTHHLRIGSRNYLSGDSGISIPPLMCLIGPTDDGMMSKSKISVGSHSVAQAFGTSTTPEMCPCTGAVPRME